MRNAEKRRVVATIVHGVSPRRREAATPRARRGRGLARRVLMSESSTEPRALLAHEVPMCRRVTCNKCNKPTYAGCGMHVEQVLGDVRKDQRCRCGQATAKAAPATTGGGGFWSNLLK